MFLRLILLRSSLVSPAEDELDVLGRGLPVAGEVEEEAGCVNVSSSDPSADGFGNFGSATDW